MAQRETYLEEMRADAARRELQMARYQAGKPKPDPKPLVPHPEDFAAWCEHPVTKFVAAAFVAGAAKQRDAWMSTSWSGGKADAEKLIEFRTRADAYSAFMETGLDRYALLIET